MLKKVVLFCSAMLLFVGCEKKEEAGTKAPKTAKVLTAQKVGTFDLTVDLKSGFKVEESIAEGFDITKDGAYFNIKDGSEYTPTTLAKMKEARKDFASSEVKGEEFGNGFCVFYKQTDDRFQLGGRLVKGDKSFDIYGFADAEADVPVLISMMKTIK